MDAVSSSGSSDFKLGDWWVRPQRNELERAEESVHVEARSMAVLVCLGRHAPNVVTKERLFEEVWSDSPYVGDDVISHAIWELRKALGDSARDPVYIQTVPRKGYRLVAEILRPQGSPLPMAGVQIDHYDIKEELGRGAMGVVYEAVDRRLGRTVAIKFLAPELTRDPEACRRFEREARLAASLEHPNLATVHEIGETSQGHRYLVGSYYRGGSLKDRLGEGPIEVSEALRWMRQLLAGLSAAHERDIVHRDIKPANLLLDEHGTLKICDFGIAKLLGATDLTRTGAPLGTPAYKSPEQTEGRPIDHRTDLWSAGVVFFELLTGRRPFGGEEHAVVRSILSKEPQVLEDARGRPVAEPLRRFVARALAKDPSARFQNAVEMASALDTLESKTSSASEGRRGLAVVLGGFGAIAGFLMSYRRTMIGLALAATLLLLGFLGYQQAEFPSSDEYTLLPGTRDHLVQGRTLWLRGNHPANLADVRWHFERAVKLQPDSAEALGHLAVFLAERSAATKKQEDREEARRIAREARIAHPSSSLARAAESWILLLEGDLEEGERLAREAIEIEPECDRGQLCDLAYRWLAEHLLRQGLIEDAFEFLEKGTRVGDGHIRCRLKRAQHYLIAGQKSQAEREYLQVLDLDSTQTTALLQLSNYYLQSERAGEAIPLLRRLYDTTQDPDALNSIGYAQYMRGLWPEAIVTYRRAHEAYEAAGRSIPTPLMAIGDIYLEDGEVTEARVYYATALEIFESLERPGTERKAQHAVCLAKLGHLDEAEKMITELMPRAVDVPSVIVYSARIYALKGDKKTLLELATRWTEEGHGPARFYDDPAFRKYREDREYVGVLEPELISAR